MRLVGADVAWEGANQLESHTIAGRHFFFSPPRVGGSPNHRTARLRTGRSSLAESRKRKPQDQRTLLTFCFSISTLIMKKKSVTLIFLNDGPVQDLALAVSFASWAKLGAKMAD